MMDSHALQSGNWMAGVKSENARTAEISETAIKVAAHDADKSSGEGVYIPKGPSASSGQLGTKGVPGGC